MARKTRPMKGMRMMLDLPTVTGSTRAPMYSASMKEVWLATMTGAVSAARRRKRGEQQASRASADAGVPGGYSSSTHSTPKQSMPARHAQRMGAFQKRKARASRPRASDKPHTSVVSSVQLMTSTDASKKHSTRTTASGSISHMPADTHQLSTGVAFRNGVGKGAATAAAPSSEPSAPPPSPLLDGADAIGANGAAGARLSRCRISTSESRDAANNC